MSRLVAIAFLLVLTAVPAAARPVTLGREDIARAWLRLEEELRENPPGPADRARLGSQFDVKTRAFFRGGFGEVVRGIDETVGWLPVLAEHPAATRKRHEKRIAAQPGGTPPQALAKIRALMKKKNPYAGRAGDHWRVVEVNGEAVPYRIFVPEGLEKPAPLVFFLHAAGADGNAFFEGYGFGIARDLAARWKFVAVAPATIPLARKAGLFPALLDTVIETHMIDPKRVYVVGHSMGAFTTGFLARKYADRLAATCQIARGTGRTGDHGPPVLYVLAGRDGILRLKAPAETELLTVRRFPDEAHTWVVPTALPGILDWLFGFPKDPK